MRWGSLVFIPILSRFAFTNHDAITIASCQLVTAPKKREGDGTTLFAIRNEHKRIFIKAHKNVPPPVAVAILLISYSSDCGYLCMPIQRQNDRNRTERRTTKKKKKKIRIKRYICIYVSREFQPGDTRLSTRLDSTFDLRSRSFSRKCAGKANKNNNARAPTTGIALAFGSHPSTAPLSNMPHSIEVTLPLDVCPKNAAKGKHSFHVCTGRNLTPSFRCLICVYI